MTAAESEVLALVTLRPARKPVRAGPTAAEVAAVDRWTEETLRRHGLA